MNRSLKTQKFLCKSGNTSLKSRGVFFLLFVVFIGAIAVNSGNNLVYLTFSTVLSFILISGFLSFSNLKGLEAEIKFPDFIFAKSQAYGFLIIKNRSNSPKFRLMIKIFEKTLKTDIVINEYSLSFTKTFKKRGVHKISDAKVTSDFPFGFFERKKDVKINQTVIVFPEVRNITLKKTAVLEGKISKKRHSGDEFYSIRKYNEGEDSRKINWKLTAKANELMVVETRSENEEFRIFFDTSSYLYENEEEFEDALIRITSFVYNCFVKRIPISFTLNSKLLGNSSNRFFYQKIFNLLATVKPTETPPLKIPDNFITYEDIIYV